MIWFMGRFFMYWRNVITFLWTIMPNPRIRKTKMENPIFDGSLNVQTFSIWFISIVKFIIVSFTSSDIILNDIGKYLYSTYVLLIWDLSTTYRVVLWSVFAFFWGFAKMYDGIGFFSWIKLQYMKSDNRQKFHNERFCSLHRVEFSKQNIEISIMVTKASKPRSFEASKLLSVISSHNFHHFPHHFFIIMFLIIFTTFLNNIFSSFLTALTA